MPLTEGIRARFSDTVELVTNVPISGGDIETWTLKIKADHDVSADNPDVRILTVEDGEPVIKNVALTANTEKEVEIVPNGYVLLSTNYALKGSDTTISQDSVIFRSDSSYGIMVIILLAEDDGVLALAQQA